MSAGRHGLAITLIMLMIIAPPANAGLASWSASSTIDPHGGSVTVTGFEVPGNLTVLDGWVHVTNADIGTAMDSSLVLEGADLLAGGFDDVAWDGDHGAVSMLDDGTLTNISDFSVGTITPTFSDQYVIGPGHTRVHTSLSVSSSPGCSNSSGVEVSHGLDDDHNGQLDSNETVEVLYYCDVTITANNTTITYHALTSLSMESAGANCTYGGHRIEAGVDNNTNQSLDTGEITSVTYICHDPAIWSPVILSTLRGSLQGANRITSNGTIPSIARVGTVGTVVAVTLPGGPVPAGTDAWLATPLLDIPDPAVMNGYWMTFDHWYHVDSTASGGGDGVWVEYRMENGTLNENWSNWSWIAPDGGYPSTLSTDGPDVNGSPSSGALPVFASPTASGWVTSNITLSNIPEITHAAHIQFRFRIWTSPNASTERPGWFIDDIEYNNDGADDGAWHHGCIVASGSCTYAVHAYGALQTTIDLSGTDADSWIEADMEWDLQGGIYDNACVELSLNNSSWTDISSDMNATTTDCGSRSGAIPGNGYPDANGQTYYDESGALRTINLSIPATFRNQSSVHMRIIVDTSRNTGYGGSYPMDSREGLTVSGVRVHVDANTLAHEDAFNTSASATHHLATRPSGSVGTDSDEWGHHIVPRGAVLQILDFEDSVVNESTVSDADGWSRDPSSGSVGKRWTLGQLGTAAGPDTVEPSFPYVYGTNLNGLYDDNADASLISPTYDIPANTSATLTFEKWICMRFDHDALGLYISVNNGSWQYFDPGIAGWYDGEVGSMSNALYGEPAWLDGDCYQDGFENRRAPLSQYAGDTVQFRFRLATASFSANFEGGYIDDFGVLNPNYSSPGTWTSPLIDLSTIDGFNLGWLDAEAFIPNGTNLTASLIDASTGAVINGFEDVELPISLATVDPALHDVVKVQVHLDSVDPRVSPRIERLAIGGKRYLTAAGFDGNGWDMDPGVEVIAGLLNATTGAGAITSPYLHSSRPIKGISVTGNHSGGIPITAYDHDGHLIGTVGAGGVVAFTRPVTGFALSIELPTSGWIDRMVLTADFADPARNPAMDVLADGTDEWSFPYDDDHGHYGWQSLISGGAAGTVAVSRTMVLDGTNATSATVRIPVAASIDSGLISIASHDPAGFAGAVTVSVAGASQTGGSGLHVFHNTLDGAQMAAIDALGVDHTDAETGRGWREVTIEVGSNVTQTVSLSRLGIGYTMYENVSGLGPPVAAYHDMQTTNTSPSEQVGIPVAFSADAGVISVAGGDVRFDHIVTNRDLAVPATFHPRGEPYTVTTRHHHARDNALLSAIVLRGQASAGEVIEFRATNSADGQWGLGSGSQPVNISQVSGTGLMVLDSSASGIVEAPHDDGYTDIAVNWVFDVSWHWDDVDSIQWVAMAFDANGETAWPAVSNSGLSGRKAVENDLWVTLFEVRDRYDRLISDLNSMFHPYPIAAGSMLDVTGQVRFQDATSGPIGEDFLVHLDLSGSMIPMESGDDGRFSALIPAPTGVADLTASPVLSRVGPLSGATGAEDVSGAPSVVTIRQDRNPPVAGPLMVSTDAGPAPAHGMVWHPAAPLSLSVTVEEAEAHGETLTLRYWRAGHDDQDGDGIADEEEYLSQTRALVAGMTGEQQVDFAGIAVHNQSSNDPVHIHLEGTDWAGLSYRNGSTGGGPGAENAWATVVVAATDGPTSIVQNGFALDDEAGYLLAGAPHTFRMRIREPNGIQTLDNVSIMLCGSRPDNVGTFTYDPATGVIWTAADSLVSPLSVQTLQVTDDVVEIAASFEIPWGFPWKDGQSSCRPSVSIIDGTTEVAHRDNISELTWELDNRLVAIPSGMSDLTPPLVETDELHLHLRQGDEFEVTGGIHYTGSGVAFREITDDLRVEMRIISGTPVIDPVVVDVADDGTWAASMSLPMRRPQYHTMDLRTTVLNVPGHGSSAHDTEAQVTVDSAPPVVLFDATVHPDSSLAMLASDRLAGVLVTVTIIDDIGMPEDDLQVAWVFLRDGLRVAGTEANGALPLLMVDESGENRRDVFRGRLDLTPVLDGFVIEEGDRILFWVTSTDRAGNAVQGSGSAASPRPVAVTSFNPSLDRVDVAPKDPQPGTIVHIETFWSNDGSRGGTIEVNLYELTGDNEWRMETSTIELELPPGSSSVRASFEWVAGDPGRPALYIIKDGDLGDPAHPIGGIVVSQVTDDGAGSDPMITYVIIGGVLLLAVAMVGLSVIRSRRADDGYHHRMVGGREHHLETLGNESDEVSEDHRYEEGEHEDDA